MWGGVREETMPLRFVCHSAHFQSVHHLPICHWHPLASTWVETPRVNGYAFFLGPCGFFKWTLPTDQQFILPPQLPLVFTANSYKALFFQHWNPGLHCLAWVWDWLLPRYPSWFYPPHMNMGLHVLLAPSPTPLCCLHTKFSGPRLHRSTPSTIWVNITSLNPWLLDFNTVRFSGSSGCFCFEVSCVPSYGCARRWIEACLPAPPSWLEVLEHS